MAYTVVVTTSGGSYTFAVTPKWKPKLDNEIDRSRAPAIITGQVETWVLEDAVYTSATQASVTTDFGSLRTLFSDTVTSVAFKRDGSTVFEMTPTSHVGGVFMQTLDASGQDGEWANYWKGTLVVWGRKIFPTLAGISAGLSALEQETVYTYDAAGLSRVTSRGRLRTLPGTSAETAARARALDSPGQAFGLVTAGPDDEPSVTVSDYTDTEATWESTWQEHGESLPAGVNEWSRSTQTSESGDGGITRTITARAKGPTLASLRDAVRAEKTASAIVSLQETEDPTKVEFSATYQEAVTSTTRALPSGLVYYRVEVDVQGANAGEERDDAVYPVPGYAPFYVSQPRQPITITERITARYRGALADVSALKLASAIKSETGLRFQPGRSSTPPPRLSERALVASADLWEGSATHVYLASEINLAGLFGAVRAAAF